MLKRDFSISEIAKELSFHKSTIYREIKRNWSISHTGYIPGYFPQKAQKLTNKRKENQRRKPVITGELKVLVEKKIKLHWSPDQISGRLKKEGKGSVSHVTIYKFIRKNMPLQKYLKYSNRRGTSRLGNKRSLIKNTIPIADRPKSANNRTRFGHWERDGMYGANRKQILVCLERKSRFVRLGLMKRIDSNSVNILTKELLKNEKVLSITNDNGSEFRKKIDDIPVYHCDPMRPDQRWSVENVIGQLRSYIKRNTSLELINCRELKEIEDKINLRPRKMFDYQTPYEVYYKKKVALAV